MTDKTIEMAHKAGARFYGDALYSYKLADITFIPETLKAFEALIRADERKKIAEWYDKSDAAHMWSWYVEERIKTGEYLND
jgi:hypothetical protein